MLPVARVAKLPRRYMEHLVSVLKPWIDQHHEGKAAAFARKAGIAQSQLSSVLGGAAGKRGVGVVTLIALRKALNVSIDDLLGLPPLSKRSDLETTTERLLDRAEEIARLMDEQAAALRKASSSMPDAMPGITSAKKRSD